MKYRVNEIFYSLQGEGYYTGTAAVFLRFSGCNRACRFCDTDFTAFEELTAGEIIERVSQYPSRHIVCTGGEPLLQLDDVLIRALKAEGFYIQIETNGSLPVPTGVDWVTCSPKRGPWRIDRIDELKLIYSKGAENLISPDDLPGDDPEAVASLLQAPRLFLQACSRVNEKETIVYILDHPKWRLSLQTHKLLDIR